MVRVIECRGAPRDLGRDQGENCARAVATALAGRPAGPLDVRVERDVWRHFPHLAERCAGLARAARVSRRDVVRSLAGELGLLASVPSEGIALGLAAARAPSGPRLVRVLPAGLVLRRSLPDAGFASLEATLPALPGALAGVNEAGLAAAVRGLPAPDPGACAAPAGLLAQHCLQHFEGVEQAVDWCLRRPGGGRAALLFADASRQQGVLLEPRRRTHLHASDGLLLAPGPEGSASLEKELAAVRQPDGAFFRALVGATHGVPVWLDPGGRRLGLLEGPPAAPEADGVRYLPLR